MMMVMPSAPMATITVWVNMILKLPPVYRYGRTSELSENRPSTRSRPKNGPSTLIRRKRLKALPGADVFMNFLCSSRVCLSDGRSHDPVFSPLFHWANFRQHAPAHHADGVAYAEEFRQIRAYENNRFALC